MEKLRVYNRKRNFKITSEPKGNAGSAKAKLRLCVQHHIASKDHYDFRLEWDGAMLSWAVPKGPSYNVNDKRLAVKVEDHPLAYRNFEGIIPEGEYGGGTVMLWDKGFWEPESDVEQGLRDGTLKFVLKGKRLKGAWALVRFKGEKDTDDWLLVKEKDKFAKDSDGISGFATSVKTGRTMDEIRSGKRKKPAKNPFFETDVQLAKIVDKLPQGKDWVYEIKYDGYRILAYIENGSARLATRNGKDFSKQFGEIAKTLEDFAGERAMILDGEMVVADETGKSDFQALQNHLKKRRGAKDLTYVVFDLLALDGEDLRKKTLLERKAKLEKLLESAPQNICFSKHIEQKGEEMYAAACKAGLEGIMGKKADSTYSGTRNSDWIKMKCGKRQEFVVGGYTVSDKQTNGVSSLLLGVYLNGEFIFVGRAGTGFSETDRLELEKKFKNFVASKPSFSNAPKPSVNERFFWLKPEFVAEVKFAEWTKDNLLRQASFKGLREDKNPKDVKRETANVGERV